MAHSRDTGHNYQRPSATNGASQINGDVYFTSGQDPLNQLPIVHEASHDSAENQDDPLCLEGTRDQVQQDIYSWQESDDDDRCIFWLSGMAGTGKSTIARTVAHEFQRRKCLVASFFFSRGSGKSESASFLFTSLAKQLATPRDTATQATSLAHVAFQDALRETLRQEPDVIRKSRQEQWNKLIIRPLSSFFAKLQDVSPTTSAVLVIDALDECSNENDIKGIIRTMARQQLPHARLRIIITSRPETLVRLEFSDKRNILHSSLSLDDVPQHVIDADLARFLHSRFDAIRDHQEGLTEDWPGLHALNKLLRRCGGLFIYAETLCLYLEEDCQHSQSRLQTVLNKTTLQGKGHTTALDDMYLTVLTNAFKNLSKLSESEKDRSKDLYDHVVGSIVVLQDDLSASTLSCLTQVSEVDIMAILHRLRSVIKHSGIRSPITLLHETFREFVSDQRRCKNDHLAVDTKIAHRRTFNDCLHVLSAHLKQDLCDLKDPGVAVDDPRVDPVKILDSLPLHVQYAVCRWTIHLGCSGIDATDLYAIDKFLHKHLLHWVEAMSWLNKYAEAVESISRLYELLELGTDLKLFCWDARKFMISNGSVIARNPLQIYCSALIFSPKNSLVCRASSEESPSWLLRYRSPFDQWDQRIFTLPLSEDAFEARMPIAFSPDSSTVAFDSGGCVDVWSSKSGTPITSLEVPCTTDGLLFSPDGKHLAFMTDVASIWLYDTVARTIDYVLETNSGSFDKFLFSPNGVFLVSISLDQVNMWTVAKGELYWTLMTTELYDIAEKVTDHIRFVPDDALSLEVSNNSSMIATRYPNHDVKVWNIETKSLSFEISLGDIDDPTTFGFSANHNLIIVKGTKVLTWSPSSNTTRTITLSIEDPGDGRHLKLTHWLSPDRSMIATLKDSCYVFLYNTMTGEWFKRITFGGIQCLRFSPDSTRLALQSHDEVILHDTTSLDRADTFPIDYARPGAVLFSPDGSMLATLGIPVQIWDISVIPFKAKPEARNRVSRIRLSVDGTLVIYSRPRVNMPSEIHLLDVLRNLPTTIEYHFPIGDFSISPDKTIIVALVASESNGDCPWLPKISDDSGDGWACLYNLSDKTSLYIPSGKATAFSNSSQLLAIAGLDFKVQIWGVESRECITTLEGHSCAIIALEFSPSDARLASTDANRKTMVWDYRSNSLEAVFLHQSGPDLSRAEIVFSSDESMLAYAALKCGNEEVYLCGLETKTLLGTFSAPAEGSRERTLSFSDDGRYLRTSSAVIDLMPLRSPCLDLGQPLDISDSDGWIRWHGRKVLRLPDDWLCAEHDSWGNKLAIGTVRREVAFIEFDPQELRKALGI
ncbi:hypothetical protein D6D20_07652 [Aureobasidium pullulans]|uniref:NACHT domain-containing protein n=1 Tax=Aureobasidium pullulans TaxID=5580 RepID=A0A4V4IMF8_AURPU|nr:hypothetical protein D6D20_07652 [Aureobasidium pullulans]